MSSYGHEPSGAGAPVTEGELQPFGYGRGWFEILPVTNPSAGAEATLLTGRTEVSRLVTIAFLLTTSAVAANRFVSVEYQDGNANVWARAGAAVVVTANSTQEFTGWMNAPDPSWAANTPVFFSLPSVFIEPGRAVVLEVDGIDAADTLTQIFCGWERFPTGPRGFPIGRVGPGGRHAQHARPAHIHSNR